MRSLLLTLQPIYCLSSFLARSFGGGPSRTQWQGLSSLCGSQSTPGLAFAASSSNNVVRCRARVAYDGSHFQGFQIQTNKDPNKQPPPQSSSNNDNKKQRKQRQQNSSKRTVQGELERILNLRLTEFGAPSVRVVASGRTDSGVHARGQAIHFDVHVTKDHPTLSPSEWLQQEMPRIQYSVTKMGPPDVAIWNLQVAPGPVTKIIDGVQQEKPWNAMYDSTFKWYSYRIHVGPVMNPLERHHRWHPDNVHKWFDEDRFRRLLQVFEGSHDFRAFANNMEKLEESRQQFIESQESQIDFNASNGNDNSAQFLVDTVRTVRSVQLIPEFDHQDNYSYRIDFLLEGALYKQVRNMVGTVVEVCRQKSRLTEEQFLELLHSSDKGRRDNPAKPAPPHALCLEHVYFEEDGKPF